MKKIKRESGGREGERLDKNLMEKNSERNGALLNLLEGPRNEKEHWYTRKIFTFTVSINGE